MSLRPASRRCHPLCPGGPMPVPSVSRPLAPSLDLSSVYEIADLDQIDGLYDGRLNGFFYARDGHPNAVQLADKMAEIEGGRGGPGLRLGHGRHRVAPCWPCVSQGDHVVISDGLYGKTTTLVARELVRFGVTHDSFDPPGPTALASLITARHAADPRRDPLQPLAPRRRPRSDRAGRPRGGTFPCWSTTPSPRCSAGRSSWGRRSSCTR